MWPWLEIPYQPRMGGEFTYQPKWDPKTDSHGCVSSIWPLATRCCCAPVPSFPAQLRASLANLGENQNLSRQPKPKAYPGILMHYTHEHCNLQLVVFSYFGGKSNMFQMAKMYLLRSPAILASLLVFGRDFASLPGLSLLFHELKSRRCVFPLGACAFFCRAGAATEKPSSLLVLTLVVDPF